MRPSAPPSAHVAVRLRASVSALMRRLREGATVDALPPAKWSVLAQLHRHGPLAPTALARLERVRLQTLTRLLADVESAGLIVRAVDPDDARARVLTITTAGRVLLTSEVHRREASLRHAVQAVLSETERTQLLAACTLLDRVALSMAGAGEIDQPVSTRRASERRAT